METSPTALDEIRTFFGNHHSRGVGGTADECRHDRSVDDACMRS
jgi:hypothetical protein